VKKDNIQLIDLNESFNIPSVAATFTIMSFIIIFVAFVIVITGVIMDETGHSSCHESFCGCYSAERNETLSIRYQI